MNSDLNSNSKSYLEISYYKNNIFECIDDVKKYIFNNECPFLTIDVSKLNMIDATKSVILCSTFHFAKYPDGNITWQVNDLETLYNIRVLKLKNIRLEIKSKANETIKYFEQKYRINI